MKRYVFSLLIGGFLIAGLLFFSDAYSQEPFTKAWEFELKYPNYTGLVYGLYVSDINGDRKPEILLASLFHGAAYPGGPNIRGRLVAVDSSGKEMWWYETDRGQISPFVAVSAADTDGDAKADAVLAAYDLEVLNPLSSLWGDPDGTTRLTNSKKYSFKTDREPKSLAVDDIDSDGKNEILFGVKGSEEVSSTEWYLYCLYKGGRADKWKHKLAGPPARIVVADLEEDGAKEIVLGTTNNIYSLDSDGDEVWSYYSNETIKDLAVYDLDADGKKEILVAIGLNNIVVFNKDGKPTGKRYRTVVEPLSIAVDDTNNDGIPEIFYAGPRTTLVVLDVNDNELFRLTDFRGYYGHSIFLYDMNRDGKKDMIFVSDDHFCRGAVTTPTGEVHHTTVYVYYNNFPSVAIQQAGSEKIARDYFDLAEGFLASGQNDKAREYYIKACDAYAQLGNAEMITRCNTRIEEIGTMTTAQTQPPETEGPKESGIAMLFFLASLGTAFIIRKR